jgi:hypothetical protein
LERRGAARPLYTPDQAARCLLGQQHPPAVAEALRPVFGGDTDLLLELVARPASTAKPPAKGEAEPPAFEEVPTAPRQGAEAI